MKVLTGEFLAEGVKGGHPGFTYVLHLWRDAVRRAAEAATGLAQPPGMTFRVPPGVALRRDAWPLLAGGRPLGGYRTRHAELAYTLLGHVPED